MKIWWRALVPLLIIQAGCVDLQRPELVAWTDAAASPVDAPAADGEDASAPEDGPPSPEDGPPGPEDGQYPPDTQEPDAGPDPLPAGARCDRGWPVRLRLLRPGRLLRQGLRRDLRRLQPRRAPRAAAGRCRRARIPAQSCAEEPLLHLRARRHLRRRGRLPPLSRAAPSAALAAAPPASNTPPPPATATATPCPEQTTATTCTSGHVHRRLLRRPLRRATGSARRAFTATPGAARPSWRPGSPAARERSARPGSASTASAAAAPAPRPASPATYPGAAGTCPAVPSGQDPRGGLPGPGRRHLRAGGRLQRQRRLPPASGQHRLRGFELQRHQRDAGRAPATAWASAAPRARLATARPTPCGATACATTCADSSGCTPGFSCSSNTCARSAGLVLLLALRGDQRFDRPRQLGQRVQRHLPGRSRRPHSPPPTFPHWLTATRAAASSRGRTGRRYRSPTGPRRYD